MDETMTTTDREWKKSLLEKGMKRHIDEFRLFQSLCTGVVHDDERGVAWVTWCMRNPKCEL